MKRSLYIMMVSSFVVLFNYEVQAQTSVFITMIHNKMSSNLTLKEGAKEIILISEKVMGNKKELHLYQVESPDNKMVGKAEIFQSEIINSKYSKPLFTLEFNRSVNVSPASPRKVRFRRPKPSYDVKVEVKLTNHEGKVYGTQEIARLEGRLTLDNQEDDRYDISLTFEEDGESIKGTPGLIIYENENFKKNVSQVTREII